MGTRLSAAFRCHQLKILWALIALCLCFAPQLALAQSGVDNSTASGVFQLESDAQRTPTICFLPFASGGPAIATPVAAGTNQTDGNGCPTINASGASATWKLISYGANTDDWSSFVFSNG